MKKSPLDRTRARHGRRPQRGTSMIEVLVALLILVFGVLGIAALQMTALRNTQSSMQHTQAIELAYGAIDRMRANVAQARLGAFNLGKFGTTLGGTGTTVWTCALPNAGALPANERREWISRVQQSLGPGACGIIDCNDLACDVAVRWDDSRGVGRLAKTSDCVNSTDPCQLIVTRTRL